MTKATKLAAAAVKTGHVAPEASLDQLMAEIGRLKAENAALSTMAQPRGQVTADIDRESFFRLATPLMPIQLGKLVENATGNIRQTGREAGKSLGWYASGKSALQLGVSGKFVGVSWSINVNVTGSGDLPGINAVPDRISQEPNGQVSALCAALGIQSVDQLAAVLAASRK